jgi:large subunit ribosomal protein L6
MSRIGNALISVPSNVEFTIGEDNVAKVKGPKGSLEQWIDPCVTVKLEDGELKLSRQSDHRDHRAKHGLYRSLLNNMVEGVTNGYKIQLQLIGVGFRAKAEGQMLEMTLGYSHPFVIQIPKEISLAAETEKGKAPLITLESYDKQLLGAVAAKLRSLRKPEPYKGKGVRYIDEYVRRKAGKAASK